MHTGTSSNEIQNKASYGSKVTDQQSRKKRLRRNDRDPGTDEQAEASGMEDDAGGSSQDRYESDFINDDGREEIEAKKARRLKQG